ncbi:MAG: 50S ribosomal protein L13 [Candidatus Thermoplasmatota archaeon]|nr:50S ribosomal protein L13 [Candidatus Thermoplasmatota archaeon]
MVEIIDASGLIIGRLGTHVAKRLLSDNDLEIAIVNSEKAIVSGTRKRVITCYRGKRELNHPRKGPYFPRMPDRILKRTIRGMLPYQQPKGREALKRVKVYIGVPKEFEGKKMKTVASARNTGLESYLRLEEISRTLGANI